MYYNGKKCIHGHGTKRYLKSKRCVTCTNIDANSRYKTKKKEYLKISNDYYHSNKETYRKTRQKYYKENKEIILERNKKWKDNNKPKRASDAAKRRAIKKQAMPKWANLNSIEKFYKNCPKGMHVDHIIPLVNTLVCGLHVENNLQYLSAIENMSKNNYFKAYTE